MLFNLTKQLPTSEQTNHLESHPTMREAIMISGTSNMTFQALATTTMPDLALIAGSRQTRAMSRRSL